MIRFRSNYEKRVRLKEKYHAVFVDEVLKIAESLRNYQIVYDKCKELEYQWAFARLSLLRSTAFYEFTRGELERRKYVLCLVPGTWKALMNLFIDHHQRFLKDLPEEARIKI